MSLFKYLTSRTFFTQAFLALAIVVGFTFLVIQFLDFRTNHGQEIKVPDLAKMKLEIAEEKLNELDLEVFLLDTVEFNADFPPFTILEQDPKAGSLVNPTSEMPLTTVSDTKNVRAYFTMNEKQLLFFNKTFNGATTAEKLKSVPEVSLLLVDNSEYDQKGKITATF